MGDLPIPFLQELSSNYGSWICWWNIASKEYGPLVLGRREEVRTGLGERWSSGSLKKVSGDMAPLQGDEKDGGEKSSSVGKS